MKEWVSKKLNNIETEHNVMVIYACESGSRAWGFPSQDSDYDVRFIYVHPRDWYVSITEKRDVIEVHVEQELDINGWDLRKSLRLLRKSNSPLLEWLSSPIVYRCVDSAMIPFIELSRRAFLPGSAFHHYLSMARSSIEKFQNEEEAKIKSYLYALRTILCCKWIIKRLEQPPMLIQDLLSEFIPEGEFRQFIDQLILKKREGSEEAMIKRSDLFEGYLDAQVGELRNQIAKNTGEPPLEAFDYVFREILGIVERSADCSV